MPLFTNTHAAPALPLSSGPPTMAVFPSADTPTDLPCAAPPTAPAPTSLSPCWLHTPLECVNTHAAPTPTLSSSTPTIAVFPSADSATERTCVASPTAPVPTSLSPCWLHTPLERVYSHAAPTTPLSLFSPTMPVPTSAHSPSESPFHAPPTAPAPTSLSPCWLHVPPERVNTHTAPTR